MPSPNRRKLQTGVGKGRAAISGVLKSSTTAVGNVDTGVDDLISLTILADELYKTNQALRITAWGKYGADGNNKEVKLLFGGTAILTSGVVTQNDKKWVMDAIVIRTGKDTQDAIARMQHDTVMVTPALTALTIDEDADIIVKLTGETTATNMIIAEGMIIEVLPAP